jgi:hypothetical protein
MQEDRSPLTTAPLLDVIEHWARSRIDTPLNLIGRYDEGARQVIALTAALQGANVAILSFGDVSSAAPSWTKWFVVLVLVPAMFFALRCICTVSPEMEAMNAYKLMEAVTTGTATPSDVRMALHEWCTQVDRLVSTKRRLLHAGNLAFLFGSAIAAGIILWLVMP